MGDSHDAENFLSRLQAFIFGRDEDGSAPTRVIFQLTCSNKSIYEEGWNAIINGTNASDERNRILKPTHGTERNIRIDYTTFVASRIGNPIPVIVQGYEILDMHGSELQYKICITIQKFNGILTQENVLAIMQGLHPRVGENCLMRRIPPDAMNMILSLQRGSHPNTLNYTCQDNPGVWTMRYMLYLLQGREQRNLNRAFKEKFFHPIPDHFDTEKRLVFMDSEPDFYQTFRQRFIQKIPQDPLTSFTNIHIADSQNPRETFSFFVNTAPSTAQHIALLPDSRYFRILLEVDPHDTNNQKIIVQGMGYPDGLLDENGEAMNLFNDPKSFTYFIKQLEKLHGIISRRMAAAMIDG